MKLHMCDQNQVPLGSKLNYYEIFAYALEYV